MSFPDLFRCGQHWQSIILPCCFSYFYFELYMAISTLVPEAQRASGTREGQFPVGRFHSLTLPQSRPQICIKKEGACGLEQWDAKAHGNAVSKFP